MNPDAGASTVLRRGDPRYPARLEEVLDAGRRLRVLGDLRGLDRRPILAVVGTRTPAPAAARLTGRVVREAAGEGMTLVSGLSPGVDLAAHRAALREGMPQIAVPGCGLAVILRSERGATARAILRAGGVLVSIYPDEAPETPARRRGRDRVIAALADALIVTASEAGGGAWTAHRWARRLGRAVIDPDA